MCASIDFVTSQSVVFYTSIGAATTGSSLDPSTRVWLLYDLYVGDYYTRYYYFFEFTNSLWSGGAHTRPPSAPSRSDTVVGYEKDCLVRGSVVGY